MADEKPALELGRRGLYHRPEPGVDLAVEGVHLLVAEAERHSRVVLDDHGLRPVVGDVELGARYPRPPKISGRGIEIPNGL